VVGAADAVMKEALDRAGISMEQVKYTISTGYGRRAVSFARKTLTEIICHGAGVSSSMPEARTVIDIGGQDSKVIKLNDRGAVMDFVMNDKCAAGTGRFLEVMAHVLEIRLDDMGAISLRSSNPSRISSTCTVFAESEVVSLRAEKVPVEDIIAGLHRSIARRVVSMGSGVGYRETVVATGGVAKNIGIVRALESEIRLKIVVPDEPQIMGAVGAAIMAGAELARSGREAAL